MKKILVLLFILLFTSFASAQEFDFTLQGDELSNEILTDFILEEIPSVDFSVVSYFYDLDNDGSSEIIGIIKSNMFYNLKGYKLFVLTKKDRYWVTVHSDINFDNTKPISIEGNKITYFGGALYNGKKYKAHYKNGEIKTNDKVFDIAKTRKVHQIEELTNFSDVEEKNKIDLNDFNASTQKNYDVFYKPYQNNNHKFEIIED